jgi:hypothetical protein
LKIEDVTERWGVGHRSVRNWTNKKWTAKHGRPRLSFVRIGNKLRFREADILAYEQRFVKGPSKNEAPAS